MKAIYKKMALFALGSFLLASTQVALAEMRDLTKDEIMTTFSDKTVWGNHARKEKRTRVYFSPDGTYKSKRLDEKGSAEGKWSVNDNNQLCMERDGDTKCRRVVDKKGKIKKYKGKKHVWNYTKFKDGNQL